jgi:hypothetical protein
VSFCVGPPIDFGKHRRAVSVDPATTAGVIVADIWRSDSAGAKDEVGNPRKLYKAKRGGAEYALDIKHFIAPRGHELRAARFASDAPYSGPMSILMEAQYIGVNPSSSTRVIEARTRWSYAFEVGVPCDLAGRTRAPEILLIPPSTWQSGWLGLASQAGRDALKIASNLSAETAVARLGGATITGKCVDDEADALNMFLWWLSHHLVGLPRRFMTSAERSR